MSAILEVRDLVKEYPGVQAVAGVSFSVAAQPGLPSGTISQVPGSMGGLSQSNAVRSK